MTLPDAMQQHLADTLPQDAGKRQVEQVERAYMAGALEALRRVQAGESAQALQGEVMGWARSCIGREVTR
jgi:hypothetical protein